VQTVLHFFTTCDDFESAVIGAVNRGDDADTTGALVGMLAGARCGAASLPRDWLKRLASATRGAIIAQTTALLRCARERALPAPAL
jgi:ADP-ribosyl-[dinitrogen reductase] hydrolase